MTNICPLWKDHFHHKGGQQQRQNFKGEPAIAHTVCNALKEGMCGDLQ